jgi:hypothetical protein
MGFAAEVKGFISGFKTGRDIIEKGEDREDKRREREERGARENRRLDLEQRRQDTTEARYGDYDDPEQMRAHREFTRGQGLDTDAGGSTEQKARERYDYWIEKGYSPQAAAGIVGNMWSEGAFNSQVVGDQGTSYGEFQHRGPRWTALKNYAAREGKDHRDWRTQIDFADWEMKNTHRSAYAALQKARDPEQAAGAFALYFERPKGAETGNANNILHIDRRRSRASQVYNWGGGGRPRTREAGAIPDQVAYAEEEDWQPEVYAATGGVIPEVNPNAVVQGSRQIAAVAPSATTPSGFTPRRVGQAPVTKSIVDPATGLTPTQARFRALNAPKPKAAPKPVAKAAPVSASALKPGTTTWGPRYGNAPAVQGYDMKKLDAMPDDFFNRVAQGSAIIPGQDQKGLQDYARWRVGEDTWQAAQRDQWYRQEQQRQNQQVRGEGGMIVEPRFARGGSVERYESAEDEREARAREERDRQDAADFEAMEAARIEAGPERPLPPQTSSLGASASKATYESRDDYRETQARTERDEQDDEDWDDAEAARKRLEARDNEYRHIARTEREIPAEPRTGYVAGPIPSENAQPPVQPPIGAIPDPTAAEAMPGPIGRGIQAVNERARIRRLERMEPPEAAIPDIPQGVDEQMKRNDFGTADVVPPEAAGPPEPQAPYREGAIPLPPEDPRRQNIPLPPERPREPEGPPIPEDLGQPEGPPMPESFKSPPQAKVKPSDRKDLSRRVARGIKTEYALGEADGAVPDPQSRVNQERFARNEGAPTHADVQQIFQKVDPRGVLEHEDKMLKAMQDQRDFWLAQGRPDRADRAVAGLAMYSKKATQVYGNLARAAAEDGNYIVAAQILSRAYANIPDGRSLQVTPRNREGTEIDWKVIDRASGEEVDSGTATPDTIMQMSRKLIDGSGFMSEMARMGEEYRPRGRGAGGRAQTSVEARRELSGDQAEARDAMVSAGKALQEDPENEEKRNAFQQAEQNFNGLVGATDAGRRQRRDAYLDAGLPLPPSLVETPGTRGGRGTQAERNKEAQAKEDADDKAAADALLKEAEGAQDPATKRAKTREASLIPLDRAYNRQVGRIKRAIPSDRIQEQIDAQEVPEEARPTVQQLSEGILAANPEYSPITSVEAIRALMDRGTKMDFGNGRLKITSPDGRQFPPLLFSAPMFNTLHAYVNKAKPTT